jgi:hypothetical protein
MVHYSILKHIHLYLHPNLKSLIWNFIWGGGRGEEDGQGPTLMGNYHDAHNLGTFYASLQFLDSLSSCVHSNHKHDMHMIHFFELSKFEQ